MRNGKRYLGIIVVILALSGVVTGCGQEGAKSAQEEETGSTNEVKEEDKVERDFSLDNYKELGFAPSEYSVSDFDGTGEIEFRTEYPVIDSRMESISCIIENHTGADVEFGAEYVLEVQGEDGWYQIPFPENMAWNSVAFRLPAKGACGKVINLAGMEHRFHVGEYRVVMKIGERLVKAEFSMGESEITPATPFGFLPLEELPQDYELEDAVANGDVVFTFQETYNMEKLLHFAENVRLGLPAMVRLVSFTVEGDPIIYDIQQNVDYGGMEWYHLRKDFTRDQFSAPDDRRIWEQNYSYLVTDGENLYLSNYAEYREDAEIPGDSMCIVFQNGTDEEILEQYGTILGWTEEMTEKRLAGNVTRLKVMNPEGSWYVCLDKDQEKGGNSFGYGSAGYGESDVKVPDPEGKIVAIVNFEWLDAREVRFTCKELAKGNDVDGEERYFTIIFRPEEKDKEARFGEKNYVEPEMPGLSDITE